MPWGFSLEDGDETLYDKIRTCTNGISFVFFVVVEDLGDAFFMRPFQLTVESFDCRENFSGLKAFLADLEETLIIQ